MTSTYAPNRRALRSRGTSGTATVPDADLTAIYCRKSKKDDKEQVTVNRQKRLALADCEKLGLSVDQRNIFTDNGVSAWRRNRKRKGWDELIKAARRGEVKHIVCYHPDRLMRQPRDLEELLSISDEYGIMLYGRVNARNLQDPDDRYALRIEIAHACRSSDDTSRRMKDQKQERAESGLPNGARAYGYTPDGLRIVAKEAAIVKEIFDRFIKGERPYTIGADLNRRGIKTAMGRTWTQQKIASQLQNKHVAGICWHNGKEAAVGKWLPVIPREQWDFAQELLAFRSSAAQERADRHPARAYTLRGLVVCGNCGAAMSGCSGRLYRCSRSTRTDASRCARTMVAGPLEHFVEDAAIRLLTDLTISPRRPRTAAAEAAERAIADDEQQLRDLHDMWLNKEIDSAEYRRDRRTIRARIQENEKKTIVKVKSAESVAGLIGPGAEARWKKLTPERKNSVLRFLFRAVIIGPGTMNGFRDGIDYSRIEIEENELA